MFYLVLTLKLISNVGKASNNFCFRNTKAQGITEKDFGAQKNLFTAFQVMSSDVILTENHTCGVIVNLSTFMWSHMIICTTENGKN